MGGALGALGAAAVVVSLVVALRTLAWAPPSVAELAAACERLLPGGASLLGLAAVGLAALAGVVVARGAASFLHGLRGQRRAMSSVKVEGLRELDGMEFAVISDDEPRAFCTGYLRPRVYLSTGALGTLGQEELSAVLAHESHHRSRHDPLRMLLGRVLSDALFFLPGLRRSSERYAALSELAADEAAIRKTGEGRGLAAALLAFGERGALPGVIGIAPERVDHLMGERPRWRLSPLGLAASGLIAAALAVAALAIGLAADGVTVDLALAISNGCMVLMVALPALTAIWVLRRGRGLLQRR